MVENQKTGIYEPLLENIPPEQINVCPGKGYDIVAMGQENSSEENEYNVNLGFYSSFACYTSTSSEIHDKASSGGVMTEIALYLLSKKLVDGVLVTKFDYSGLYPRPKSFIAKTKNDLLDAQGSKYCPVPVFNFEPDEIFSLQRLAFIGTPCQIAALKLLQKKGENFFEKFVYTIGNFCGGFRDLSETDKLINRVGGPISKITNFQYRGDGQPGKMKISTNENVWSFPYPDYSRFTGVIKHKRCRLCVDATAELADFSCGDAWLPRFISDDKPWSICITRNQISTKILSDMQREKLITKKDLTYQEIIESQKGNIISKKYRQNSRIKLFSLLKSKTPKFDGGFHNNSENIFLELKVLVSQSFMNFLEKNHMYKIFAKLMKRYPEK
jgi:coenzyme F420 hydrogenase subunit beta